MNVNATELKNRLGKYLEASIKEPVIIDKSGRKIAVIISYDLYQELQAIEDAYWAEKAVEAEKSGYLGTADSMRELANIAEEKGKMKTE